MRENDKPNSVFLLSQGGDNLSGSNVAITLEQPTQTHRTNSPYISSLLGLAPYGVCTAIYVAINAVSSYLTISPLLQIEAVYFLLHFPSVRLCLLPLRYKAYCSMVFGLSSVSNQRLLTATTCFPSI